MRHESHLSPELREMRIRELVDKIRTDPEFCQKMKMESVNFNQNAFVFVLFVRRTLIFWLGLTTHKIIRDSVLAFL